MSIQLTIHKKHHIAKDLCHYLSSLIDSNFTIDEFPTCLEKFLKLENITELFPLEIQEVNKCFLIYQEQKHLYTIKFVL